MMVLPEAHVRNVNIRHKLLQIIGIDFFERYVTYCQFAKGCCAPLLALLTLNAAAHCRGSSLLVIKHVLIIQLVFYQN